MMKIVSLLQGGDWGKRIFVLTFALCIVPAVPVSLAQELLPELAAPAAQHKAADEMLDKQKLDAIALAAKSYVSALDSVEKAATAKGELDLVAAVVKEREAVASGTLEPSLPAALPKARLQMSRKTLLASVERINADFAKRKKTADADYLRALAALQTKAASNPELAKQIAAEKAALLGGVSALGAGAKESKATRGKNVVENGDFSQSVEGKPAGWKYAENARVEKEGENSFIRFVDKKIIADGTVPSTSICQEVTMPKGAQMVTVSAKIRTTDLVSLPKVYTAGAAVEFSDQDGKACRFIVVHWSGKNGAWKEYQVERPVLKEASKVIVRVSSGQCPGQIDFDDIVVTFK